MPPQLLHRRRLPALGTVTLSGMASTLTSAWWLQASQVAVTERTPFWREGSWAGRNDCRSARIVSSTCAVTTIFRPLDCGRFAPGRLLLADIPGTVTVKATYEPNPDAGEVYTALLKEFVNLYEKTKGIHKRLNGRRLQQLTSG